MDVRIFGGWPGRAPLSEIELVEAQVAPEELARRREELRKRELLGLGQQGFTICLPEDFDADTYGPWQVRIADQTVGP